MSVFSNLDWTIVIIYLAVAFITLYRLVDGRQKNLSPYSIKGQLEIFRTESLVEIDGVWYLVPGNVNKASDVLLEYFVLVIAFLIFFENMI